MTDKIIDLTQYLHGGEEELPGGTFALWGADGERSRFALPLWRIIHLSRGGRGVLLRRLSEGVGDPDPFVILDLVRDPARTTLDPRGLVASAGLRSPTLVDNGGEGLLIYLGARKGKDWMVLVDGGQRDGPLDPRAREDILFLAGECAGLLFLKDLDAE